MRAVQCPRLVSQTEQNGKNGGSHIDTRIHLCLPFDCISKVSTCLMLLPPWCARRPWWAFSPNCGPKQTLPSYFFPHHFSPHSNSKTTVAKIPAHFLLRSDVVWQSRVWALEFQGRDLSGHSILFHRRKEEYLMLTFENFKPWWFYSSIKG